MTMKRHISRLFVTIAIILFFAAAAFAQPPLPPGDEGGNDWQPAPIGAGIVVLLSLAGLYGAKRVYDARRRLRE
jgi:hypothetical protein